MKMSARQCPAPLLSACTLAFGVIAISTPVHAQSAPYALTEAPAESPSPLMMSAAALAAVADGPRPSQAVADDDWQFRLSFPIWMPGLSGDMTVKGRELSGGGSDSGLEFFDTLDFAAVLRFEAEKGRWGAIIDTMYVSFSDDKDLRTGGTAEATVEGFIGELDGFYTLLAPKPGVKGWGMFRADVLAGLRVSVLELGADGDRFDASRNTTIVDPLIGARMELGLTDWLSFKLRGDIGGFGLDPGTTSNFAWNVETGFEFHLAKWFDVGIGYRWLDYDYKKSGDVEFDLQLSGPVITLQFRF